MKPKRIILIRHAESEGNVNKGLYFSKPDYSMEITSKGVTQAIESADKLEKIIKKEEVAAYVSPFYRTRQTYNVISKLLNISFHREDPRIIEQEWRGNISKLGSFEGVEKERDEYGHFYFRFNGGESCADVYNRVTTFLDTLHRDFEKSNFPKNALIVTHGMTLRIILMRWFHWTVEEFELIRNPANCGYYILELQENNKYKLITPLKKYPSRTCKFSI